VVRGETCRRELAAQQAAAMKLQAVWRGRIARQWVVFERARKPETDLLGHLRSTRAKIGFTPWMF
jgi:hypothetical protein